MIIVHDNTAGKGEAADYVVDIKVDKSESPVEDSRKLLTENYKKSRSGNAPVASTDVGKSRVRRFGVPDRSAKQHAKRNSTIGSKGRTKTRTAFGCGSLLLHLAWALPRSASCETNGGSDTAMATRVFRCAIEEIADWHANLYVEPHVAAFVAVASQHSPSPALFNVECDNLASHWLGKSTECRLEVSWREDTAEKAARLRATLQAKPLVELASVALALILGSRIVPLGQLLVTDHGDRADYRARKRKAVLEVSGTENPGELGRRHREKVAQARGNPFGWEAYVVVCAFSVAGHRIRFSRHPFEEAQYGKDES
jgi:hypothetical protein